MLISTKVVFDMETLCLLERKSYQYDGPIDKLCGATAGQEAVAAAQAKLANQMSQDYATIFGENSAIMGVLKASLEPIVSAGPNQPGWSLKQSTALQGQAENLSAQGAQNAEVATQAKEATAGGGSAAIPSGANEQINAMVNNSAGQNLANTEANLTAENYNVGRENFNTAVGELAGAPGMLENPATGAGSAASNADTSWMNAETTIQQANDEWIGAVTGMVGSIGGMALGGALSKGGALNKG